MMTDSMQISRLNLAFVCLTALGVGVLWGFAVFKSTFSTACQERIAKIQLQKHSDDSLWRQKYEKFEAKSKADLRKAEGSLAKIQGALERYGLANTILKYGKGPHVVDLTLEYPAAGRFSLQVELQYLEDMPHTIFTFLSMVDLGLYDGTVLVNSHEAIGDKLVGGDPQDMPSPRSRSVLLQRYAELGYGSAEPILLKEANAKAPCSLHRVGMVGQGPQFAIFMSPDFTDHSQSCPGRILSGEKELKAFVRSKAEMATIVSARIVVPDHAPNDEL